MKYTVYSACESQAFCVPDAIVDNYMKLANPKHLCVLLWMFRHAPESFDAAEIAGALKMDETIVKEAIFYWIDNGVVAIEGTAASSAPVQTQPEPPKLEILAPKPPKLTASMATSKEILARAEECPEFKFLLQKAQDLYGRTISFAEQSMLLSMLDYHSLPVEVILMMIEYAVSIGKSGTSYLQKMGENWAEQELNTLEKAEEKIAQLRKSNAVWTEFARRTGISHPRPSPKQEAFFMTWLGDWNFSLDMIVLAYEEMQNHTTRLSFAYMNKVLINWKEKGLTTPQAVAAAASRPAAQTGGKQAQAVSYDISQFERSALEAIPVYRKKGEA